MSGNDPEFTTAGHLDNSGPIYKDEIENETTSRIAVDGKLYNDKDLSFDPQVGYVPRQGAVEVATPSEEFEVNQKHLQELRDFRDQTNLHDGQLITETEPSRSDIVDVPVRHNVSITEALLSQDVIQQLARENEELRRENEELKRRLNPYNPEVQAALDPNRRREPDYLEQVRQTLRDQGNRQQEQFIKDVKQEDEDHNPLKDPEIQSYVRELEQGRNLTEREMVALASRDTLRLLFQGIEPEEAIRIAYESLNRSKDKDGNINSKRLTSTGISILLRWNTVPKKTEPIEQEEDKPESGEKENARIDPIETKRAKLTVKALLLKGAGWTGTQIARASLALVEFFVGNRTNHIQEELHKEEEGSGDPARRVVLEKALSDWEDVYQQTDAIRKVLGLPIKKRTIA